MGGDEASFADTEWMSPELTSQRCTMPFTTRTMLADGAAARHRDDDARALGTVAFAEA